MWVTGFGPAQALSHSLLRATRLTTPAHPPKKTKRIRLKKLTIQNIRKTMRHRTLKGAVCKGACFLDLKII